MIFTKVFMDIRQGMYENITLNIKIFNFLNILGLLLPETIQSCKNK